MEPATDVKTDIHDEQIKVKCDTSRESQGSKRIDKSGISEEYKKLVEEIKTCKKCTLNKERINAVIGRGNIFAKVFLIGEAPGEDEDEQGIPFVGRSGKFLNQVLGSLSVDPSTDVYISNCIRCRPPDNRKPKKKELELCIPFLKEEIELIKPTYIITLGSTAAESLAGRSVPIAGFAGKFFKMSEFPNLQWKFCKGVFISYHPAAVLYEPALQNTFFEHWAKIKKQIQTNGF
jgi:DNA polymerase